MSCLINWFIAETSIGVAELWPIPIPITEALSQADWAYKYRTTSYMLIESKFEWKPEKMY